MFFARTIFYPREHLRASGRFTSRFDVGEQKRMARHPPRVQQRDNRRANHRGGGAISFRAVVVVVY